MLHVDAMNHRHSEHFCSEDRNLSTSPSIFMLSNLDNTIIDSGILSQYHDFGSSRSPRYVTECCHHRSSSALPARYRARTDHCISMSLMNATIFLQPSRIAWLYTIFRRTQSMIATQHPDQGVPASW